MSCCSYSRAGARPTSPPAPSTPQEFLCPICGFLMENPVVADGHTFDRACIEACIELRHTPPILSSPPSPPLAPNLNLNAAILRWCARSGHRLPFPISRQESLCIVVSGNNEPPPEATEIMIGAGDQEEGIFRKLTEPRDSSKPAAVEEVHERATSEDGAVAAPNLNLSLDVDDVLSWCARSDIRSPFPAVSRQEAQCIAELLMLSVDQPSQQNQEEGEAARGGCNQEERLFMELTDPRDSAKLEAIDELLGRLTTVEADRAAVCNPRIMAALVAMMWYPDDSAVRTDAIQAVTELAKEPPNAIKIVGSGAVPAMLRALAGAASGEVTRCDAACALGVLAEVEGGLRIMAVLGAAGPLREACFGRGFLSGDDDLDYAAEVAAGTVLGKLIRRDAAGLVTVPAGIKDSKSAPAA